MTPPKAPTPQPPTTPYPTPAPPPSPHPTPTPAAKTTGYSYSKPPNDLGAARPASRQRLDQAGIDRLPRRRAGRGFASGLDRIRSGTGAAGRGCRFVPRPYHPRTLSDVSYTNVAVEL